jgi:hypothetical protein
MIVFDSIGARGDSRDEVILLFPNSIVENWLSTVFLGCFAFDGQGEG